MKRIFFIPLFLILLPKLAVAGPDDYVPSQIAVNIASRDPVGAAGGFIETSQNVHQRGFAGARRPLILSPVV